MNTTKEISRERNFVTERAQEQSTANKKTKIDRKTYLIIKRNIDIVLSFMALVIFSPIMLLIAIAIKIESKGSAFFVHKRVGMHGNPLGVYKFRSMVINSEEMLKTLTFEQKKEYEENYKITNDTRITKVGNFLRKTSLDELPQILNILKGELSIVGPRPVIKAELEKYGNKKDKFLSVKPGLTGYWQVNGRSGITYEERMELELYYVDNASLWLDTKIFFKTFAVVLFGKGAM